MFVDELQRNGGVNVYTSAGCSKFPKSAVRKGIKAIAH